MSTAEVFKKREEEASVSLPRKGWFVIRLDGKAFHTFTDGLNKPFDKGLSDAMEITLKALCAEIQNVKFGYTQSDEISLIMSDLDNENTSLWFDGNVPKIVSVAASIATAHFNKNFKNPSGKMAYFDARVFALQEDEVTQYLNWRQKDAFKNAVTLISLKHYSHKQIHSVNTKEKIAMINKKNDSLESYYKGNLKGVTVVKSSKRVPSYNPKTKETGYSDRTVWISDVSFDYRTVSLKDILK